MLLFRIAVSPTKITYRKKPQEKIALSRQKAHLGRRCTACTEHRRSELVEAGLEILSFNDKSPAWKAILLQSGLHKSDFSRPIFNGRTLRLCKSILPVSRLPARWCRKHRKSNAASSLFPEPHQRDHPDCKKL